MKITTPYEFHALIWDYFFRSFGDSYSKRSIDSGDSGDSYSKRPPPLEEIPTLFIGYVKLGLEIRGFQSIRLVFSFFGS